MIPLDGLRNTSSGFSQNCNFFWQFLSIVPFHLVFVVAWKIKLIPHLSLHCSYFEWPEMQHANVSWPSWELIRFWSLSVDFTHFGSILLKQAKFAISGIFLRTQRRNGLKFGMLMYSDHLQNRLEFGHGLLIFLIWVPFWLSKTGQTCGFPDFL